MTSEAKTVIVQFFLLIVGFSVRFVGSLCSMLCLLGVPLFGLCLTPSDKLSQPSFIHNIQLSVTEDKVLDYVAT